MSHRCTNCGEVLLYCCNGDWYCTGCDTTYFHPPLSNDPEEEIPEPIEDNHR